MVFTLSKIASIIGADAKIASDCNINIFLTDSRSLSFSEGTLFFAIRTGENDGHRYIKMLYESGVRSFIVNHIPENMTDTVDCNFLIVSDTVEALQRIGASIRDNFNGMMIAITGSRGKTVLKEWLYTLLRDKMQIVRSPRSYNSCIGVPLSLHEISNDTELAIIEAGISVPGEMCALERMIRPHIAVITNIESEHDNGFASQREKAIEKAFITRNAQIIIFPWDDVKLREAVEITAPTTAKLLGFSFSDVSAPLYISDVKEDNGSTYLKWNYDKVSGEFIIPLVGKIHVQNACSAFAVMLALGIAPDIIAERMTILYPVGTRLNVTEGVNGCSLIYDKYTSDLSSLWPALDFMTRRAELGLQRTIILSDLHTDASPENVYPAIVSLCKRAGVTRFIGIGDRLCANARFLPQKALLFHSTAEFMKSLSTSDFSHETILLKGSPEFNFDDIAENLEARTHETVLEVNLDAIVRNFNYFRRKLPREAGMVVMVKASGYGAGSLEIARTLQSQGATYLAVAVVDEGIYLRNAGISMPIMVMNPKVMNYKALFSHCLEPEIYTLEMLADVIREAEKYGAKNYPIHIKIDTGMHRMGFSPSEMQDVAHIVKSTNAVKVASVFSHLATADCPDMTEYTLMQLDLFSDSTEKLQREIGYPFLRHILNTAGILTHPEASYDMARLGIGLYGVNPIYNGEELSVVSTLRTVVITVHERKAGESVGYGRRGMLMRDSRIATIPIGYADGLNRHLGCGNGHVFINGCRVPIVGNICMDACMIDVTDVECKPGDVVEIFGHHIKVEELAMLLDTIPYEILTSVSPRVKRVYYRE